MTTPNATPATPPAADAAPGTPGAGATPPVAAPSAPGAAPGTPPASGAPTAPQSAAPDHSDPAWLPERLHRARAAERSALFTKYGVTNEAELDAKLAELARLQDATKTEAQRTQEKLVEAEKRAARAGELEESVRGIAEDEMARLTQEQRDAVVDVAGTDPAKQLKALRRLKKTWAASPPAGAAGATPPAPPAPNTVQTPGAAPAPGTPVLKPGSKLATYEALKVQNAILAARFYTQHAEDILAEQKTRGQVQPPA